MEKQAKIQERQPFTVTFKQERLIKLIPERRITTSSIEIREFTDSPVNKTVVAKTNIGDITLWSGKDYDAIGDWTNQNVIDRINEIYSKKM